MLLLQLLLSRVAQSSQAYCNLPTLQPGLGAIRRSAKIYGPPQEFVISFSLRESCVNDWRQNFGPQLTFPL